jgi:arginase
MRIGIAAIITMRSKTMRVNKIDVIGVPWDEKSTFMHGCSDAPDKIWNALFSDSTNSWSESGFNLNNREWISYRGTTSLSTGNMVLEEIQKEAASVAAKGVFPIFIGGDHAVTYPLIKGLSQSIPDLNILHFDAHPDLYDSFEGDRYSHACPFARIMEEGLAKRLVSVGIRSMTDHLKRQKERLGVEIFDMRAFDPKMTISFTGPVYLSLDLDVLDPAFAPGVSHHEPGGLTTRELIRLIQSFEGTLIGADIVEYNPYRDVQNMTAMVAAKLLKEIAARFID